jgi:phosphatidylinositol glycan class V
MSCLSMSVCSFFRSNGILSCWFFVFNFLNGATMFLQTRHSKTQKPFGVLSFTTNLLLSCFIQCIIVILPFVAYLYWSYTLYCGSEPHVLRPWCQHWLPDIYSYVQATYWNVGFLKYYQLKQIPNFLLATPIVILSLWGILSYGQKISRMESRGYYSAALLPFILYWSFLLVFGVLFMHVQVLTRFLSSCPPFYWFCATFFRYTEEQPWSKFASSSSLILFYFLLFSLLGIIMFPNFLPWT